MGMGTMTGPREKAVLGLGMTMNSHGTAVASHSTPGSVTLGSCEIRCTFELCVVDSGQWPHTASHRTVHNPLPVRLSVGCNVGCTRGWMSRARCTLGRWIAASVHACSQQLGFVTLLGCAVRKVVNFPDRWHISKFKSIFQKIKIIHRL